MKAIFSKKTLFFSFCVIVALVIWFIPPPEGLDPQAMHMLAIFLFTILGFILKPLPMGTMAFLGLVLTITTRTLKFAEAFSGFNHHVVWLIVSAFFIARGFINTGLGMRVAYFLMRLMGKSSLGMGYGLVLTDLILAPAIPSVTARVGGVLYPIVTSLAKAFGSEAHNHPRKLGAFLIKVTFQGSVITSAMFLTSMSGNPLLADIGLNIGVHASWTKWILASCVPGLLSLIVIPFFIYKVFPPELKKTPHAKEFANKKLKEMGKMQKQEWILISTFILLIFLWAFGTVIGMIATVAALIGLAILLLSSVLSWDDLLKEKGAWNTLMWFSTLIMMATYLNKLGLTTWFSQFVQVHIQGFHWMTGFVILSLIYFYSHYFFASMLAHISSMFAPFLLLSVALGTPPMLAFFTLAFFSNLFGGLTHYGCGPAPIYFGSKYVQISKWWKIGFFVSVINILIWFIVGGCWWKVLGFF